MHLTVHDSLSHRPYLTLEAWCPLTPPYWPIQPNRQIDKEFDRILRGGVFHPTPIRPAPRPPRLPRRKSPRNLPRDDPHRSLSGRRPTPDNELDGTSGDSNVNGKNACKRRGVLEAGGSLFASPGSTRGGDAKGFLGGGGKKRRGRAGSPGRRPGMRWKTDGRKLYTRSFFVGGGKGKGAQRGEQTGFPLRTESRSRAL